MKGEAPGPGEPRDASAVGGPAPARGWRATSRLGRVAASFLDPLTYLHVLRLLHFYGYAHVQPRRHVTMGRGARLAPNVSIRNGERITIGAWTRVGERAYVWAGDATGSITIGEHCLIGPEVFITASDYGMLPDEYIAFQERNERDIVIGNDVWLGTRVIIGAGVTIGDGCVVGAGSVVTRSLPPNVVAVGFPARIVRRRDSPSAAGSQEPTQPQVDAAS
jgi:acetyltransferase-like isoleucine patch superfamily enzyme